MPWVPEPASVVLAGRQRHSLVKVARAERGLRKLVQLVPLRALAVVAPRPKRLPLLLVGGEDVHRGRRLD